MSTTPDPPSEPGQQGISLDDLTRAFAQVMEKEPGGGEEAPPPAAAGETSAEAADSPASTVEDRSIQSADETPAPLAEAEQQDPCPICPRTILEAMLFVGNRDNRPVSADRAAELMRDVEADEIPPLVDRLNRRYETLGAPYRVVGEQGGYRLALREEYRRLRDGFFGRVRQARLSQAAIDVLSLVAYRQPITGEEIRRLRGTPSRHVLAHLVRRGLLRVERPEPNRPTHHYHTTERFLRLFNLESLDDLPQSEEDGPP